MKKLQKITLLFAIIIMMQSATKASQQPLSYLKSIVKFGVPALALTGGGLFGAYKVGPEIYNKFFAKNEMVKQFGYDPKFDGLPKKEDAEKNEGKIAVITAHGFGDCGESYENAFDDIDNNSFTVSFNFQDVNLFRLGDNLSKEQSKVDYAKTIVKGLLGARSINFGGEHDAKPLLYAIKQCADAGYPVALMGHSRGGATIIKALEMLLVSGWYNKKTLQKLGISDENRQKMVTSIKKIFLANPLLSMDSALKRLNEKIYKGIIGEIEDEKKIEKKTQDCYRVTKPFWKFLYRYTPGLLMMSAISTSDTGLGLGTKTSIFGQQPIETLKKLQKKNLTFDITLATQDTMVGNDYDEELIDFAKKNKNWTVDKGYPHAEARADLERDGDDVTIKWNVSKGDPAPLFGKTVMLDSCRFPFDVVARSLCYKEGEVWDDAKLKMSVERLRKLGVFEQVHLYPVKDGLCGEYKDLLLKLHKDDPFEFRFRAGFGLQGVDRHFIFGRGMTYKIGGTFLVKNPFNAGDCFAIDTDFARSRRHVNVEYTRPYLFGLPAFITCKGYVTRYEQPGFVGSKRDLYEVLQQGFLMSAQEKRRYLDICLNIGVEWMETRIKHGMKKFAFCAAQAINFRSELLGQKNSVLFYRAGSDY